MNLHLNKFSLNGIRASKGMTCVYDNACYCISLKLMKFNKVKDFHLTVTVNSLVQKLPAVKSPAFLSFSKPPAKSFYLSEISPQNLFTQYFSKNHFSYYISSVTMYPKWNHFRFFQRFVFPYFIKLHSKDHNTLQFRLLLYSPVT